MASEHLEILNRARESFVRKRRAMAEQMIPSGAAVQHFAPGFVDLQTAIEAIDRAIADEQKLPVGYAAEEPKEADKTSGASENGRAESNVLDVDFDPA